MQVKSNSMYLYSVCGKNQATKYQWALIVLMLESVFCTLKEFREIKNSLVFNIYEFFFQVGT